MRQLGDDSSVEQFCTYLTAISLFIKGDSFSEDKARVFELSDNKHIETNILTGDDYGKVELVNEQDRSLNLATFNFLETFLDDEINNPNKASNQFHPLDIVYLSNYDEKLQAVVKTPTIALYAKYLGDKGEWGDVLTATFAVIDVISIIFSGYALASGVRGIARIFAIADITISTINLAILSPAVRQALSKTEAGKWFVTHWPIISFCVSAGMLSHYLAKGILKYGKTVKGQLKNNPKLSKQIEELIEESKKVGGHAQGRSIVVTSNPVKVKAFEESFEKLNNLWLKGKLTGDNAIEYLEEAIVHFNHKVVNGKVIQIDFTNCGNTVEALHNFLKSGRIIPAGKSSFQSTKTVATKFKAGRFNDIGKNLDEIKRLNENPVLIRDGESFILYGVLDKQKVIGRNGVFDYNMKGHYMYGIKRNKTIHLYDPQTGEFAIFNTTRGSNFMKILTDPWENIRFREGYQYLKIE